ncbi:ATP-binding protein [Stappia sp. ES.058]|uniref:ATP-binding protein n=1 Tax=Stappia sp. ES.058 TaxID=1881061 RepID=UPI0008797BE1|nr:ATP-binding protein [Stappia sp. ES.058]SDT90345.1 two-component system, NtrC family, C4-dicarboxylate transport sensor histidine kinase DctB [Stappia sp. ES.058]
MTRAKTYDLAPRKSTPDRDAPQGFLRFALLILPVLGVLAAAVFAADWVERQSEASSDARARERLTLYRETLLRELEKFRYLPYLVARDPRATAVLEDPQQAEAANLFLKDLTAATGAEALYVMNAEGRTVAASNFDTASSFMGRNYAFRPYFQTARDGGEGQFFAVGATTGKPGFFFARATPKDAAVQGVVVVKVDMDRLEQSWRDGGETVIVSDVHGVVFLGTQDAWRYASIAPLTDMVVAAIRENRQYGGVRLSSLQEGDADAQEIAIAGTPYRQARLKVGLLDWTIHYFTPRAEIEAVRGIVWAGALTLILLYVVAMLVVRGRRLGQLTAGLKRDAAGLRDLNSRLVGEIDERRRVETELREAQAGLARASRLAAVGEMSAAVAHELNQPLAALGMFVSGARLYQARGEATAVLENLDEIDALRLRMASLTQELKRLARPGESRIETVDMRDCLKTSAKLVRPRIEETGVALHLDLTGAALPASTAPLRVEQVLVNLLRNAIDACHLAPAPCVEARAWTQDGHILIEIADNGAGIPEDLRERIFEPFFSTKPAASGLGLGLAISARIVDDLGGTLKIHDSVSGGAAFVLSLPQARQATGRTEDRNPGNVARPAEREIEAT